MPVKTESPVKTGLTTKHIILILGSLVIVAGAVIAVVLLLRDKEPEQTGFPIMTAENVNEINSQLQSKVDKGMFETHMNTSWTFPDGKSPSSDAIMGNAISNNYPFYFTVTLAGTGETVFTSGLMQPGTEIAEIKLEKELEAGTYDAVVGINMVDDDGTPISSNMGIDVTLVVKS